MSGVQKKTVAPDEDSMRLDRWFRAHFPGVRHGELEKLLRKGEVRVNGGRAKSNRRLEAGEEVRIPPLDAGATSPKRPILADVSAAQALKQLILYEDDAMLALNKPFGLAVQGGAKTARHVDGMLAAWWSAGERPRLVHRLDKDTGGLLLVAKTRHAAQKLAAAFKGRGVEKTYWALTAGVPHPREGTIDLAVAKRVSRQACGEVERMTPAAGVEAKKAVTDYQVVDAADRVAFLAMRPQTGRTHQLRVHAAAIGCPIVGDGKYGGATARVAGLAPKLHLFCRAMTFTHPETGQRTTLTAPLTGHMAETWAFFSFDAGAIRQWPELQS